MNDTQFSELLASSQDALQHARGKLELRTSIVPDPPAAMDAADVRALRDRQHASQAVFAHYLNVSTKLVQAWEAGRRRPEGAALRLLAIAREHPAVVFGATPPRPAVPRTRRAEGNRAASSTATRPFSSSSARKLVTPA